MAGASFNRVILLGRLTRDPEIRYIPNGTAVCDIALAVNDRRKNATTGEWIEETTFVEVTLWGRTAEIAGEFLTKASQVLIEGRLKLDSWEHDGQKRSKLKVVADTMTMVGSRTDGGRGDGGGGRGDGGGYNDGERSSRGGGNGGGRSAPRAPQAAQGARSDSSFGDDEDTPF